MLLTCSNRIKRLMTDNSDTINRNTVKATLNAANMNFYFLYWKIEEKKAHVLTCFSKMYFFYSSKQDIKHLGGTDEKQMALLIIAWRAGIGFNTLCCRNSKVDARPDG